MVGGVETVEDEILDWLVTLPAARLLAKTADGAIKRLTTEPRPPHGNCSSRFSCSTLAFSFCCLAASPAAFRCVERETAGVVTQSSLSVVTLGQEPRFEGRKLQVVANRKSREVCHAGHYK